MITRYLNTLVLLALPAIILGTDPGKPKSIYNPVVSDAIMGIQILFEVIELRVIREGRTQTIYCLCTDITNQHDGPERILVRYECQGQARTKEVKIGGKQQKIILIDMCIMKDEINMEVKDYFSQLKLEQSR